MKFECVETYNASLQCGAKYFNFIYIVIDNAIVAPFNAITLRRHSELIFDLP